jgi:ATP-dependent Clp protease, protease subunit
MSIGWPGWPGGSEDEATGAFHQSLRDHLFERRVVVVSGRLDHEVAGRAAIELMTLDADGDDPIRLQLGCAEGELDAALSLMDVVELVGVPVEALCIGTVGGAAVGVLAVAGRRLGTATTSLLLRDPGGTFSGSARDQERWASHRADRWRSFCERVADTTNRSVDEVDADFAEGRFLGAAEALDYGLLDEIVQQGPPERRGRLRPLR